MLLLAAMWVRSIDTIAPVDAAARLRRLGGLAFLDSAMKHATLGRYSFVAAAPFGLFTVGRDGAAWNGERLDGAPLPALRSVLARYPLRPLAGLPPFQGGAVGMIAYDFARHLEVVEMPRTGRIGAPDLHLAFYDTIAAFDHKERKAWLIASGFPETNEARRKARAEERLDQFAACLAQAAPPTPENEAVPSWRSNFTPERYHAAIERVREYIRAGDIYQANIAQRFSAARPAGFDPFAFYRRLRTENPAPFAAFLDLAPLAVASSSPERLVRLAGGHVEARPIKGTAPRFEDPEEDRRSAEALLASEKDRAENVMIVDLLRNDLSRVSTPDSVEVPTLCGLESYASVHHLTSVVTSRLREETDALDVICASFPGGSITGAPKIRAMEIISEIEEAARGVYCGSIGYIGFDGTMDLNIAIRTVSVGEDEIVFQAGGGITILSDPAAEYDETFAKASRIFRAFGA